jgi:hypothetical protein
MNRFGLLILLGVILGFASGAPADGRRPARRARVDVAQPEFEAEPPTGRLAVSRAPLGVFRSAPLAPARWAVPPAREVQAAAPALSSCIPGERAARAACSRAPPLLG